MKLFFLQERGSIVGLRFRKSINLGGGFRINLSKSGVGYSWGIPGYRITKSANGRSRRTYSIPGTGISWSDEDRRKRKVSSVNRKPVEYNTQHEVLIDIDSAKIEQFQAAEYQNIIEKIRATLVLNRISTLLILCILLVANPVFLIPSLVGVLMKIVVHRYGKINLEYEFDDFIKEQYSKKIDTWLKLNNNIKMWQIIQSATVTNQKVNAGASRHINRINFRFIKKSPFYIKTNIDILQMNLRKEKLVLLPDKILVIRGLKVGAVEYSNVKIEVASTRFIENAGVPRDAQVIDYTWQFVNKDGSPDRRFKSNRRLPVCLYGVLYITSPDGLNIEIQCSSIENTRSFNEIQNKLKF